MIGLIGINVKITKIGNIAKIVKNGKSAAPIRNAPLPKKPFAGGCLTTATRCLFSR